MAALLERSEPTSSVVPDRYLVVGRSVFGSTFKSSKSSAGVLDEKLNAASAKGYTVVGTSGGANIIVVMKKSSTATSRYQILSLTHWRFPFSSGQCPVPEQLNDASADGFRPVPRGFVDMVTDYWATEIRDYYVTLEKGSNPDPFTYRLIDYPAKSDHSELVQAYGEQFEVIGFIEGRLRRPSPSPSAQSVKRGQPLISK